MSVFLFADKFGIRGHRIGSIRKYAVPTTGTRNSPHSEHQRRSALPAPEAANSENLRLQRVGATATAPHQRPFALGNSRHPQIAGGGSMRTTTTAGFDNLPASAFVRQPQVLEVVPFSSATLWRKIQKHEFPTPVKLSERVTAWRVSAVRDWLESRAMGVSQ